jgi:hypothetical protein|tara:strand:+ start:139 stop:438 length:300 start_codon:yes stop_codon:yes gene_type:complete
MTPNVIKIDKNVPIPIAKTSTGGRLRSKFHFLKELEVGDSFEVNGNTPDLKPSSVMSACYLLASKYRRLGGMHRNFKVTCRTLEGTSLNPKRVRVWRSR